METEFVAADRDRLTGLIGSAAAQKIINGWQNEARQAGEVPAVQAMLLGLRRLDAINLAFGEAAGDRALVEVAKRLEQFVAEQSGSEWVVARVGGGSFLIATMIRRECEDLHQLAEQVAQIVAAPITVQADTVRLWPRVAVLCGGSDSTPREIVGRLAETLERAQRRHDRRIVWTDRAATVAGRYAEQLEADLFAARDRDQIEVVFQPQYCSETGRIVGAEALARWEHPELGQIGAGTLFSVADRADQIGHLSLHIIREALKSAANWPDDLRLSLNITATDLATGNFVEKVAARLAETGFPASRLTIEITEEVLLSELERSAMRLRELADLGVRIALDDFGAGFCNFRYLKSLPLNYLKLDRSMVEGIADDPRDLVVLRGLLAMASALDLSVIAEGIESEEQRAVIASEGCRVWQGFLGSAPLSAHQFAVLARGGRQA